MQVFDVLAAAEAEFVQRVALVRPEHHTLATPCGDWNVGEVVRHVVSGAVVYVELLGGAEASAASHAGQAVGLEEDVTKQARMTADRLGRAFAEPGALERTVTHAVGALPAEALLGMRVVECVAHGWDLTRALGLPDDVHEGLAEILLDRFGTHADLLSASALFEPALSLPSDAPVSERMLALFGRTASPPDLQ